MPEQLPVPLPRWLQSASDPDYLRLLGDATYLPAPGPFETRPNVKAHLKKRGESDPRVFDILNRLEQRDREIPGEASREWYWVKKIADGNYEDFATIHRTFKPGEELDILRLAAYASDTSYANFFRSYAQRQGNANFSHEEHLRYADVMRVILPIITDLQPNIAIGFAPQISHAMIEVFHFRDEVEQVFITLAEKHPRRVLLQPDRFQTFPEPDLILNTAKNARKKNPPLSHADRELERQLATQDQLQQTIKIHHIWR